MQGMALRGEGEGGGGTQRERPTLVDVKVANFLTVEGDSPSHANVPSKQAQIPPR